jgi:ubiquinone/menaquinone biosynthesis C-methylase UbiE
MASNLSGLNPTGRFSNRVDNYVKYRPSYPDAIVSFFRDQFGLQPGQQVADIGAGTGLFAELLLKKGYPVTCVEPNDDMRVAGEQYLSHYNGFNSVKGTGEQTNLPANTIDLVTVAQAFHWMEPVATKAEFHRILKPGGHIALIWNLRLTNTPFLAAYDKLKNDFGTDYSTKDRDVQPNLLAFFAPAAMNLNIFPYEQQLNFESLKGQLLSASYIPLPGHPRYEEMMALFTDLFNTYQENGLINIGYETKVYWN